MDDPNRKFYHQLVYFTIKSNKILWHIIILFCTILKLVYLRRLT